MYRIEEVSKKTNLTKRALRHYEEIGVISPSGRSEGGYRLYTEEDIAHIIEVKNTRDLLGASLQEIKEIMDLGKRYELLKQDYFQNQHTSEKLRLLTELEETLEAQRVVLQEKLTKLAVMIEGYDEKLTRIRNKKRELERET
ncbi:MerR family transcriptional regulator [Brevibacillus ruminantium]|uniref:MerR family transcriptional regulator n=1 Tax=Brevibacillus ruminantium TaxID=2950604 RepID=A0ABY4WH32_9BACL|nr:MerR family transcriptional regulator [Brevibacillus ruminantium]USG66432.1 MerR family transcriptional regulator [Brevibacillus ruminantium]